MSLLVCPVQGHTRHKDTRLTVVDILGHSVILEHLPVHPHDDDDVGQVDDVDGQPHVAGAQGGGGQQVLLIFYQEQTDHYQAYVQGRGLRRGGDIYI